MHRVREVFWSFESSLHERFADDHLGGDVGEFASLPRFNLLPHGFEVALHPVHTNRDAINQRERLRVLRERGGKHDANGQDNG